MPVFLHDGVRFRYYRTGQGIPFIFQHGLGGDLSQAVGSFIPPNGIELLSFDFRAHGETRPLGSSADISFSTFADDLNSFMDEMHLKYAVVGGISMGAGVSLNFALRFPKRLLGLVLCRPAWLDGPMIHNAEVFSEISRLIKLHGVRKGLEMFRLSDVYQGVLDESPVLAASFLKQFEASRAEEAFARLERMPADAPNRDRDEWKSIEVPSLVLASREDPMHPFEYGEIIAQYIPGGEFRELTPKSVDIGHHGRDIQRFIEEFLQSHFVHLGTKPDACDRYRCGGQM